MALVPRVSFTPFFLFPQERRTAKHYDHCCKYKGTLELPVILHLLLQAQNVRTATGVLAPFKGGQV